MRLKQVPQLQHLERTVKGRAA
eukprot:COSAG02_NODE_47430_length_341_cov_0.694215_1_plen_21_part_01